VSAARDGDAEAWAVITGLFTPLVWAIARHHGLDHDGAADVVRNTWLGLLDNLRRIDHGALPGWLAATAQREALNALRRAHRLDGGGAVHDTMGT
jgi:DNA-directed RNA polymerase specialized sigma24 family protein